MSNERPDFTWEEFNRRAESAPPPSDDARFQACYLHGDRTTGITCQRCDRPICGECMHPASVGFQCPGCVGPSSAGATPRTRGRSGFAPRLSGRGPVSTTVALMVITGAVFLIDLVSGGLGTSFLAFSAPLVERGQLWRLVTGVFVAGGPLQLLMNLVFIWFVGTSIEAEIGRWRMLGVLLVGTLGASAALMIAGVHGIPLQFASILGLLGAVAAVKFVGGEDIRSDLVLLGIMVAFSLVLGSIGWIAQLGAIAAGAAAGFVLAKAPWQGRDRFQTLGLVGVGAACLALSGAAALLF